MPADNLELKKGDTVEILLPELAKGTTGTLMRSCSNDCVVVAIDRMPIMQMRINVSRHLVRKVGKVLEIQGPESTSTQPAAVHVYTDFEAGGLREFYSSNDAIPSVSFDTQYNDIVIEDAYPILTPDELTDFIHLLKVVKESANGITEGQRSIPGEPENGAFNEVRFVGPN